MGFMFLEGTGYNLADVVTTDMVSGVFDQIIGLLPILIPAVVGFIGIRKGIGFLTGTIKKA